MVYLRGTDWMGTVENHLQTELLADTGSKDGWSIITWVGIYYTTLCRPKSNTKNAHQSHDIVVGFSCYVCFICFGGYEGTLRMI